MNTTGEWAHGAPQDLANLQPTSQPCYTVLLLCNAANSMTQRTQIELEAAGHHVVVHEFSSQDAMLQASTDTAPDVILCPFLTKRIPAAIYENPDVPCLVIHPGIAGDRGMSSLDWALQGSASEWGVTILQAAEELDAGDVWATENFAINREFGREPTKSSLYRKECIDAAMACVRKVLHALTHATVPRPLAQLQAEGVTKGDLQPRMKQADRRFSWDMPAHEIAVKVAAGDSQPGVLAPLAAGEYYVFGAVVEGEGSIGVQVSNELVLAAPVAGKLIGHRSGAVLIACGCGTSLWISHLRSTEADAIKLPAASVLPQATLAAVPALPAPPLHVPFLQWPSTFQEIFLWQDGDVCYLWFDFYNGAMSTSQCEHLSRALDQLVAMLPPKVLVLMGGLDFFSNGIHLNTIEASLAPEEESWRNINAINDVVKRIAHCSATVTVSALAGNAGAGGAMMALAADHVWAHTGTVMQPTYKRMELHGSEYWTCTLPPRVGSAMALALVGETAPVSAADALAVGLVDEVFSGGTQEFVGCVVERARVLAADADMLDRALWEKGCRVRQQTERHEFGVCRVNELEHMERNFQEPGYHAKRRSFVRKSKTLPCRLPAPVHAS